MRPEATGYGAAYFLEEMLKTKGDSIEGKNVLISGSGNVATFAQKKSITAVVKYLRYPTQLDLFMIKMN